MDAIAIIPHYQSLPFPAPLWLLQTLLVLGFFLHALPMNVVLGGTPIAAALLYAWRHDKDSVAYRTGKALAVSLPFFISFAITQGIVPLLFLQLIYGPMYYTSSILIAAFWIAFIALVILAYYSSYLVVYRFLKSPKESHLAPFVMFGMSLIFLFIAFLFSTNMTLMLVPEKWMALYHGSPYGLNLPATGPQHLPRYLHMIIAALAVSGLTFGCFGLNWFKNDEERGRWAITFGSRIFLAATCLQLPVGFWFLFSLPESIWRNFMGHDLVTTIAFGVAMVLTVVAISSAFAAGKEANPSAFKLALCSGVAVVLTMSFLRHQLRVFFLKPYIDPSTVPVNTQWDLLIIFVVSAVAMIWYFCWLVGLTRKAFSPGSSPGT